MKFRKKPVQVEAVQWVDGVNTGEVLLFGGANFTHRGGGGEPGVLLINTLEGQMTAQSGDWIIKGLKGEFYPCKPDIFELTYEPAE